MVITKTDNCLRCVTRASAVCHAKEYSCLSPQVHNPYCKSRHGDTQIFQRLSYSQVYGDGKMLRATVIPTTCSSAVDLPFILCPLPAQFRFYHLKICVFSSGKFSDMFSLTVVFSSISPATLVGTSHLIFHISLFS